MGYRKQIRFWLDLERDSEYRIAEIIETLKHQRQFSSAIRDGLRLLWDLKQGNVTVLLALFPWIKDALQTDKPAPPDTSGGDLKRDIDQIKQLILSQSKPDGLVNAPAGAPKAMQVPAFRTPTFDDLGSDDLVLKKDTSTDSGKNFLQSMLALQQ